VSLEMLLYQLDRFLVIVPLTSNPNSLLEGPNMEPTPALFLKTPVEPSGKNQGMTATALDVMGLQMEDKDQERAPSPRRS
jgi:hypothetical protein